VALRKEKPVNDEQMLARVLEAAYVLQEHGQELRALKNHGKAATDKPHTAAPAVDRSPEEKPKAPTLVTANAKPVFRCHNCGNDIVGEEQFCGKCGTARSAHDEPPSLQSKVASLWHMQEERQRAAAAGTSAAPAGAAASAVRRGGERDAAAQESQDYAPSFRLPARDSNGENDLPAMEELPDELRENLARIDSAETAASKAMEEALRDEMIEDLARIDSAEKAASEALVLSSKQNAEDHAHGTEVQASGEHQIWASAANARDFLEQLATSQRRSPLARFWNEHRGDIYLVIAVVLVVFVIRWSVLSRPVNATGRPAVSAAHHKPAPDADLSLFDKLLVSLGIAEAPDAPEDKGNPNTQVWVDLQTAQYYCPGADLYGKTPKGKFTSQRDAQLDQFEPAYRKACR
jgi:hypothetical protein